MKNHLQHETSPYLLQHAENPVDWYPWGEEALQKARAEDKPILLSIGYSACHWCHVMAHESFEDPATAQLMNQHFVNIKVDREERPDLDDIYMQATQFFNRGHGGWPMTVFMTPEGKPFHAGTYYPPVPRHGMPSFQQVIQAVVDAYQNRRGEVENGAAQITEMLRGSSLTDDGSAAERLTPGLLAQITQRLVAQPDLVHGGLHGGAPKFPSPMNLDFLLRQLAHADDERVREVLTLTLEKMAQGGIYDQLGFGFHRYSVDEQWLVPHFEKMLYDNAQLARVYLHAYQVTGRAFFRRICEEILSYVEREMLDASGGFYSTQDADSEGEEGKFFLWTPAEAEAVLADGLNAGQIAALLDYWDIRAGGNFEGRSIPHVTRPLAELAQQHNLPTEELEAALQTARQALFRAREGRVKPGRDEKMLAAWNGMMLAAYAEAARVLENDHYQAIAQRNADFILKSLRQPDGRLYRSHKGGESKLNAYLEDYANVIDGLLELYQTSFDPHWFQQARHWADHVLKHFSAEAGFYDTSDDHEALILRPRSLQDNATPSGNSLMALNLLRLGAYTGEGRYTDAALPVLGQLVPAMQQYPSAFGVALTALDLYVLGIREVAIIGDPAAATDILAVLRQPFRPTLITALAREDQGAQAVPELLAQRSQRHNAPTVYVCEHFVCANPVNSAPELLALLDG